jgi:hypothetical protein
VVLDVQVSLQPRCPAAGPKAHREVVEVSGNPWDIPEWHSIRREVALVRDLLGSGATALGRAAYANKLGEYYVAFFGLSVGLERLAKLVLVADYVMANKGKMPPEAVVREYGHDLVDLIEAVDKAAKRREVNLEYSRPAGPITAKIIECLDAFADARRGRYANFSALGDPRLSNEEPIRRWWAEVAELILKEHYVEKPIQKTVEQRAQLVDAALSPHARVLHFNEAGDVMQDVLTASLRTGQSELVQRYGRYYALTIVRWIAAIFSAVARQACDGHKVDAFFGAWEFMDTYTVDDSFLKTRKVWPLR